jgi:hypothetical protein
MNEPIKKDRFTQFCSGATKEQAMKEAANYLSQFSVEEELQMCKAELARETRPEYIAVLTKRLAELQK